MSESPEESQQDSRLLPSGSALFDDLERSLRGRGFEELTAIQDAVLSPELAGRDLRISSQTGSGKTVAVGFVFASAFEDFDAKRGDADEPNETPRDRVARPRVLVVAPTRELAAQLGQELSWLYGRRHLGVAVLTGGTSVGGDLRALAEKPALVVGTPGRLVDHLERGTLELSALREIVLDEADEMLDMGFRDELDAILQRTPEERRTHLVSATFSRKVQQLAKDFQRDAVLVEGTVGAQHDDITHTVLVVPARQRIDALINLLLMHSDERVLVFVRTRVAASGVAGELSGLGFSTSPLSGEMAQRERTRCLADFRSRKIQCLGATDVA
ncbi:MAG: DEAD/DEAH box helicase, partial [Acidobacteriota bacterium]